MSLECPACGEPTDSLKQYRYLNYCVFLLAGAIFQAVHLRACPSCIRGQIWRRCLLNILPANFIWPMLVLPWALVLVACSYSRGHSRAVVEGITQEVAARRESAQWDEPEGSGARITAVLALLLFWVPVLGLLTALLAWWINRRRTGWNVGVSVLALGLTLAAHALFLGFLLIEIAR